MGEMSDFYLLSLSFPFKGSDVIADYFFSILSNIIFVNPRLAMNTTLKVQQLTLYNIFFYKICKFVPGNNVMPFSMLFFLFISIKPDLICS